MTDKELLLIAMVEARAEEARQEINSDEPDATYIRSALNQILFYAHKALGSSRADVIPS